MATWIKNHKVSILLLLLSCLFYMLFAWDLERDDFLNLISLYTALFILSWKMQQLESYNFWFLAVAGLIFRGIFLFALPNLSPDFYRFLWDGHLLLQGINPYLQPPLQFISAGESPFPGAEEVYAGISQLSAHNTTNYPPLNQLFFALAAFLGGKSILFGAFFLRITIMAADLGILYLGKKLLKKLNLPDSRIFWYFLNPLIIIELTGNLHFEGVMVFFLLASLYFLHIKRWVLGAVLFACSVLIKLIPLLFLPLLFRYLKLRKALVFYALTGFLVLLAFLPFLSETFFTNYSASIGLWFQKFEFNASVYYLIRWLGFQIQGYNIIQVAGPVLASAVFLFTIFRSINLDNSALPGLLTSMLFIMSTYLFLATTVHPWYLITPLFISIFTAYRFVLLWSFLVILSYAAYAHPFYKENLWFILLEYSMVFGIMGYEILKKNKRAWLQNSEAGA